MSIIESDSHRIFDNSNSNSESSSQSESGKSSIQN